MSVVLCSVASLGTCISPWVQYHCREGALVDVLHELDQLKEATGRVGTSERGEVSAGEECM